MVKRVENRPGLENAEVQLDGQEELEITIYRRGGLSSRYNIGTKYMAVDHGDGTYRITQGDEEGHYIAKAFGKPSRDINKPTNMATRYNEGKPKLSYNSLSREANAGEARVWAKNDKTNGGKYDRGNWLKGRPWTDAVDSLKRHIDDFLNGDDHDKDDGEYLVDHIVCSAKIVSHSFHTRKDLDDRVVVGNRKEEKTDES